MEPLGKYRRPSNNQKHGSSVASQPGSAALVKRDPPVQRRSNNTGLPNQLKSGIENLSGRSMDDVKVHYNSSKPAQLNAHAYAQGNQIYLGPGQQKHLPHEAWHVVQQKQGRVKPTMQMKSKVNINDDMGLEREADMMGTKALQMTSFYRFSGKHVSENSGIEVIQRVISHGHHEDGHEIVSFESGDSRPGADGKITGDDEHIYELHEAASGAGGDEKYLKKKVASGIDEKKAPEKKEDTSKADELFEETNRAFEKALKHLKDSLPKAPEQFKGPLGKIISECTIQSAAIEIEKDSLSDNTSIMKLVSSLSHLTASMQFRVKQMVRQHKIDEAISPMDRHEFAKHATAHSVEHKDLKGVRVIHLNGGALPSATISIIGNFYSSNFKITDVIEKESEKDILHKLIAEEEERIYAEEKKSSKPADRKFYTKSEPDKVESRKALAVDKALVKEASIQASRRGVTPKSGGKIRSWHLNDTGKLPRLLLGGHGDSIDIKKGFSKSAIKSKPSPAHFKTPVQIALHRQWLEDISVDAGFQPGYIKSFPGGAAGFRKEVPKIEPGYIEVNPEGWKEAESQGRLLYDYIDDKWFLTSDHYHDFFWEIIVPPHFKLQHLHMPSSGGGKSSAESKAPEEKKEAKKEDFELHNVNNCLLDAIATATGRTIAPDLIRTIREDLQRRHLGNVGEMLFADQTVVEAILGHLGMAGTPVILFQAGGHAQEVAGGGGGRVINIFHTGALHYVGHPTTEAQVKSFEKGKSEDPPK